MQTAQTQEGATLVIFELADSYLGFEIFVEASGAYFAVAPFCPDWLASEPSLPKMRTSVWKWWHSDLSPYRAADRTAE